MSDDGAGGGVSASSDRLLGRKLNRVRWLLSRNTSIVATFAKILVGFSQCLGVFQNFGQVRWPQPFRGFVEWLDLLNIDWRNLISIECGVGIRMSYSFDLLGTLIAPPLAALALLLIGALVWCASPPTFHLLLTPS